MRATGVLEVILPEVATQLQDEPRRWDLLVGILEGLDARSTAGHDPLLGTVLAALLLPVVASRVGWRADGAPSTPSEEDLRRSIDDLLRPIALRLRVSRNDQEQCRLILDAVLRMAPADASRHGRRAIQRHPALPAARMFLGAVGRAWGGAYAEASAAWSGDVEGHGADAAAETPATTERGSTGPRRRRGRRGGRGRRSGTEAPPRAEARAAQPGPARPAAAQRDLPPVWDDDYFFAALPSVPELSTDDGKPNRYGEGQFAGRAAAKVEVVAEAEADEAEADAPEADASEADEPETAEADSSAAEPATEGGEPRRKRRRRRRRRGGRGPAPLSAPAGEGTPPQA